MDAVVWCSVVVICAAAVSWVVRDARRQARRCDEFWSQLRGNRAPSGAPVRLTWGATDDREVAQLLESGER